MSSSPLSSKSGLAAFGGGTLMGAAATIHKGDVVFQRYTLLKVLGVGGMGVVWLAHDDKLEQDVALKFVADALIHDVDAIQDLKNQTKLGLKLTHEKIVRILGFESDEHLAAIVMEYVDGSTLAAMRVDQPSQVFEADSLHVYLLHILDALEYAHETESIVHRDLKPANIMVNSQDRLKVADFGIACSLRNSMQRFTNMPLRSGSGTLHYMSPQQLLGGFGCIADDIYSLGATVFELMAGSPPFYSGDVATQIREIPAPSMTARRQQNQITDVEPIPQAWEDVVAAALSKDASLRPSSPSEFRKALLGQPFKRGTGTSPSAAIPRAAAVPVAVVQKEEVPKRRRGISVSIFFFSFAFLLLAAGGSFLMLRNPPEAPPVPHDAMADALKAKQGLFLDQQARAETFEGEDRPAKAKLAKWDQLLSDIRTTDFQADPVIRGIMQRSEDKMDHWKDEVRKAETAYKMSLSELKQDSEEAAAWSEKKDVGATSKVAKWNGIVKKFTPVFVSADDAVDHVPLLANARQEAGNWQAKAESEIPKSLPPESMLFAGGPAGGWKDFGKSDLLKRVQTTLAFKVDPAVSPNGKWDEATFKALLAYQQEKEIPMTGTLDGITLEALGLQHLTEAIEPPVVAKTKPASSGGNRTNSAPRRTTQSAQPTEETNPWSRAIQQRIGSGGSLPTPGFPGPP